MDLKNSKTLVVVGFVLAGAAVVIAAGFPPALLLILLVCPLMMMFMMMNMGHRGKGETSTKSGSDSQEKANQKL